MKKSLLFLLLAMSWAFVACDKSDSEPQVDPRDAWVGTYTETYSGVITINIPGQPMTIPVNDSGTFKIEKGPSENRIIRVDGDTLQTYGTINGNHVDFDAVTETFTEEGMTMTTTATASGNLNGNKINYTMNMTGTVSMAGLTIPMTGVMTGVATKK